MGDGLTQEEIDKLLRGETLDESANDSKLEKIAKTAVEMASNTNYLSDEEKDALGEIGNISMGSSATTLSMLLGQKVEITTPHVLEFSDIEQLFEYHQDCITVEINYKQGLNGSTIFKLKTEDTAIIADLMMGGSGQATDTEIGELQLSAVGEAMNQMMGTSSTTLSGMFSFPVDITPPIVKHQLPDLKPDLSQDVVNVPIIGVVFKLKIGDLIDSEMMQLMPLQSAKDQINLLMKMMTDTTPVTSAPAPPPPPPVQQAAPQMAPPPAPAYNSYDQPPAQAPVTVQPVQFASFDQAPGIYGEANKNLNLLMDIKLKLTVELGKTELPIKSVLELTRGSVIELDKVAGEPVDLYANGKLIAKGEVVVIEDNFGLRITSIISPDSRLGNLGNL